MTTIIAVQRNSYALLGADRQTTYDNRGYFGNGMSKISKVGNIFIASAGDGYASQIFAHNWKPPAQGKLETDVYVAKVLLPSMKTACSENGYDLEKKNPGDDGTESIIVVAGEIYLVANDFTYLRSADGIYAIGSGGSFALGYLFASKSSFDKESKEVAVKTMTKAIEGSAMFDINTGGPIEIVDCSAPKLKLI